MKGFLTGFRFEYEIHPAILRGTKRAGQGGDLGPALITLDGHRDSSLYRDSNPTPDIILVQILRRAREAGLSPGAER